MSDTPGPAPDADTLAVMREIGLPAGWFGDEEPAAERRERRSAVEAIMPSQDLKERKR